MLSSEKYFFMLLFSVPWGNLEGSIFKERYYKSIVFFFLFALHQRSGSRSASPRRVRAEAIRDSRSRSRSRKSRERKEVHRAMKEYSRSRSRSASRGRKSYRSSKYGGHRSRSRSRSPYRGGRYSRSRSRSYSRTRYSREKDRNLYRSSHSRSPMSSRRRHVGNRDNPCPSRCLGVFGLSISTTEQQIYHIFSKYGPVERVIVVIDAKTRRSRGFSFVYFESSEDAKAAKDQCTGMDIDGRRIRVDFSITQRAHTPTPGIYMGKPTHLHEREFSGPRRRESSHRGSYRGRSPSPYYRKRSSRYERSRSRSYSPRRY
ncbi:transformer-2 protein homolog beta-like isoform X2 [Belonocnema kinseyi]|uniref:transformer-2 protein homolog beta-like isoform X2 n=1 Tax=Belonocnema kinseyi TaxID=2817044 RepID=UPI00143D7491|nr:transformer-2 protein homolog beta-like isoform X2 [Belonocnema kinseyi]